MTAYAIWDLMVAGAMLAIVLRWLLHLDVELHWAACIGAAVVSLQPLITLAFGSFFSFNSLPGVVVGGGVAAALLGVIQSISDH